MRPDTVPVKDLIRSPEDYFGSADDIIDAAYLTTLDKVAVLQSMRQEVQQKLTAEEENMGRKSDRSTEPNETARLQDVDRALQSLSDRYQLDLPDAPSKV